MRKKNMASNSAPFVVSVLLKGIFRYSMAKTTNLKMCDNRSKHKFNDKKKKKPMVLVFDEGARKEYLTGFRKRNQERKKKKNEEFEKRLKQEKKRIKEEAKEAFKSLLHKKKVIPQLDDLINEGMDFGTHTVQIAEFSTNKIAEENNFIGENIVRYESDESDKESIKSDGSFVDGMESKNKRGEQSAGGETNTPDFRTGRDVKRAIMHKIAQRVQNSTIFKKKNQIDRIKNKVRNLRAKKQREKRDRLLNPGKKGKKSKK